MSFQVLVLVPLDGVPTPIAQLFSAPPSRVDSRPRHQRWRRTCITPSLSLAFQRLGPEQVRGEILLKEF